MPSQASEPLLAVKQPSSIQAPLASSSRLMRSGTGRRFQLPSSSATNNGSEARKALLASSSMPS